MVNRDALHLSAGDAQPPLQKGLLRLYSMRYCPFAHRVILVLDAKKVPYEIVNVNLTTKPEWLLQKSEGGKVPLIEFEDGRVMGESNIIADYLNELYPDYPLYPAEPRAKAFDRILFEKFNVNTFYKLVQSIVKENFDEFINGLSAFEVELKNRGTLFFGGVLPGMLDFMLWPFIEKISMLEPMAGAEFKFPKDRLPTLGEWSTRMMDNPVVKLSARPPKFHTQYLAAIKSGVYDDVQ